MSEDVRDHHHDRTAGIDYEPVSHDPASFSDKCSGTVEQSRCKAEGAVGRRRKKTHWQ